MISKYIPLAEQTQSVRIMNKLTIFVDHGTDDILRVTKEQFSVPDTTECRLWQCYMTGSYELLTNLQQTVSGAGIYGGQVSS